MIMTDKSRRQIGVWLLAGIFMIVIQTLLGGITRLTESGLSITEWNVVSGTLPPLKAADWNDLFEKYKQSSQYQLLNEGMQLSDFKRIFWWEYIHRLWARLFIPVFLIPLIYFIIKRKISPATVVKSIIALVLGAMQGLVGWIMVESGLKDRAWVGATELTIHFILAMILLGYMSWIALEIFDPPGESFQVRRLKPFMLLIVAVLFIQLCYGGLMAGTHAALFYPTFPKIGSNWIPEGWYALSPGIANYFQNPAMIQLIHRSLGFLLTILIFIFFFSARKQSATIFFRRTLIAFPVLVVAQVLLGILTLLNSLGKIPILFALAHQMCALMLLLISVMLLYQVSKAKRNFAVTVPSPQEPMAVH